MNGQLYSAELTCRHANRIQISIRTDVREAHQQLARAERHTQEDRHRGMNQRALDGPQQLVRSPALRKNITRITNISGIKGKWNMERVYGGLFVVIFLRMELFQQLSYVHTAIRYPNYSIMMISVILGC